MCLQAKIKVQFSPVAQSCPTLLDPMDCSPPGFPVLHQLPEFTQTHVHWVGDAIQPTHPLSLPSPPTFSLSQHQGLFQWVSSSHQVAKELEFQLQHQSFQWIFRTDFLWGWLVWSPCCPRDSQESFPTAQFRGSCITWCGGVGQGKRPQALKILRQVSNQLLWIPLSCEERDLPPWCPWLLLYLSLPHPQMKPFRWC